MKFSNKMRFSKGWFTGLVLGVASSAVLVYGAVTIPNTFNTGDPISAAEMNANFTAIEDAFNCPGDMVEVGSFCIDIYEASVWDTAAGGGTQFGTAGDDYLCADNGNDCSAGAANPIYALSEAARTPSTDITWFQAQQACANVGKRLPTNAEWQMAAAGTVDPGPNDGNSNTACNTNGSVGVRDTDLAGMGAGAVGACISNWGAEDMVGNVSERVADWLQGAVPSNTTLNTSPAFGSDGIRNIGPAPGLPGTALPAALLRGGDFTDQDNAGVFSLAANAPPEGSFSRFGFRCAR